MKATGEVMSVGRTMEESLLKAVRSLEIGLDHLESPAFAGWDAGRLLAYVKKGTDDRIYAVAQLLRLDCPVERVAQATGIDPFFLHAIEHIVHQERALCAHPGDAQVLHDAKRMGFSDSAVARLWGTTEEQIFEQRKQAGILPVYKMIDSCASEFDSYIPYFYSTYEQENESIVSDRKTYSWS